LQKTLEDGCGAGSMQIDASTGSFHIVDNAQPRVIRVDFPALPAGSGRRIALRENGMLYKITTKGHHAKTVQTCFYQT
jgi:hypothetical protein